MMWTVSGLYLSIVGVSLIPHGAAFPSGLRDPWPHFNGDIFTLSRVLQPTLGQMDRPATMRPSATDANMIETKQAVYTLYVRTNVYSIHRHLPRHLPTIPEEERGDRDGS